MLIYDTKGAIRMDRAFCFVGQIFLVFKKIMGIFQEKYGIINKFVNSTSDSKRNI